MGESNSSSAVRVPTHEEGGRTGAVWWYLASVEGRFSSHEEANAFLTNEYGIETDGPLTEIPVGGSESIYWGSPDENKIIARAAVDRYLVLDGRPHELFATPDEAAQRAASLAEEWKEKFEYYAADPLEWKFIGVQAPRAEETH